MKRSKTGLVLLSIFLGILHAPAQSYRLYTTDHHLSNSLINQIYQDHVGYIWVCTEYGLNKFDGQRFTHYYHHSGDSLSLKNNYVRTIFEDSRKRLWVGCINGLMRYSREQDSFEEIPLKVNGKQVAPHVTGIIERHNGEIWLSTSGQGAFILSADGRQAECQVQLVKQMGTKFLSTLFEDSRNNLWFGSENDGLIYYNGLNKRVHIYKSPELDCDRIHCINEDRNGHLFVGTLDHGLYKIDLNGLVPHSVHNKEGIPIIKSIHIGTDNKVIIGTDGQGIKQYNPATGSLEDYPLNNTILPVGQGKIHALMEDRDGNHWIGVFQKGILNIPKTEKRFHVWNISGQSSRPQSGSTTAIFQDRQGDIWASVDGDGLFLLNRKGQVIRHYAVDTSIPSTILAICQDTDGQMWLGTYGRGLLRINPANGLCTEIPQLKNLYVTCILEGPDKKLYVGTLGSGFWIVDRSNPQNRVHYLSSRQDNEDTQKDELHNDYINALHIDRHGNLWIGHYKGVSCFNIRTRSFLNNPWKRNRIGDPDVCYTLLEDRQGHIWCGTQNGAVRLQPKERKQKRYTTREGLCNNIICGILEDANGNIWCSTYRGIGKLNQSDNHWTCYYVTDGLQGNQFTNGAVLKDREGQFYMGGTNGISLFDPLSLEPVTRKLQVRITAFHVYDTSINSRSLSDGKNIIDCPVEEASLFHLGHNDNTFTIEFSTFDFSNPERIVYQYRMAGLSNQWTTTRPGANRVTYNNLRPGTYTFAVRACDQDNCSDERRITIRIATPWYTSGWAITCYVLLILAILSYLAYTAYSRWNEHKQMRQREQEEKINEAKLQFFINISHEIRTPMTLIINPLEKLLKESEDGERRKTYNMMYRNGQRILRLINQLLDVRKLDKGQMFIKCQETDLVGFITDLMHTFEYQAQKKNIAFEFCHQMEVLPVWIDIQQFDKILLNLLSNAFKYTPDGGEITVNLTTGETSVEFPEGYFQITVTDSGIGIDKDQIDHIFERFYQINNEVTNTQFGTGIGLHLTKSLAELHHGSIKAANREDRKGAVFTVRFPLGNSYLKEEELVDPAGKTIHSTPEEQHPNRNNYIEQEEQPATDPVKKVRPKTRHSLLIVEDEKEIRHYLAEEFRTDYKIQTAQNGREALEQTLTTTPDLIICDVMMPVMDGITFCKKLKQNPNICHIPVVLLTAKSKFEDKMEGLETGADAYIVKPFHTEQLRGVVQNLITNRERLRSKYSGTQQQENKIEAITLSSADEILMDRVMKVINDNIGNSSLSVEMIAREVGISRVHLHRKLKEMTSLSARDFIKSIRMKQAADLLSAKKMNISDVAYAVGYGSLSHFSSSFHDYFGMAPKEYMNLKNNSTN